MVLVGEEANLLKYLNSRTLIDPYNILMRKWNIRNGFLKMVEILEKLEGMVNVSEREGMRITR